MLHFQINPHSGVPIYRQIIDQVKYYLASGALKPGDQLPSIRDLAQSLTVNPTTVVRVYTELERDGVLDMQHGKGAFVAAHSRRLSMGERRQVLKRLARSLAVEAVQMGASTDEVMTVVRDAMADLDGAEILDVPVKLTGIRGR